MRPNDPPFDVNDNGYRKSLSSAGLASGSGSSNGLAGLASGSNAPPRNPEADSFAYVETLLESLAVLGKLGTGLDIVAQKLPSEIYSLVEATVEEVSERAEYGRRGSMLGMAESTNVASGRLGDTSFLTSSLATNALGIAGVAVAATFQGAAVNARRSIAEATNLRLTALESSTKRLDQEILRDLFWTLYSKLIAVSEGLRVVYEVANRIGSVCVLTYLISLALFDLINNLCRGETTRTLLVPSQVHFSHLKKYGLRFKPRSVFSACSTINY